MIARDRILALLADGAALSRFDMAERLGLHIDYVHRVTRQMAAEGEIRIQHRLPFFTRGEKLRAYWVRSEFYRAPVPRVFNNPFNWKATT